MTRRRVEAADGRVIFFDETTGKYYAEDEPEEGGLKALDEHPRSHNPNREPGEPWGWIEEEGRWAHLREVKLVEK